MTCPVCSAGRSQLLIVRERGRTERTSVTCLACRTEGITPIFTESETRAQRFAPPCVDELVGWTPASTLDRYYYPGDSSEPPKEGYRRHEIRSIGQGDRLSNEIESHYRERTLEAAEGNQRYFNLQRAERRDNIDREMRRTGMDGSGRARMLRDAARKFVDARAELKRRKQLSGGPNFNIQVFNQNQGNRQDYSRDGRERGRKA
jgi:hypothetical protein